MWHNTVCYTEESKAIINVGRPINIVIRQNVRKVHYRRTIIRKTTKKIARFGTYWSRGEEKTSPGVYSIGQTYLPHPAKQGLYGWVADLRHVSAPKSETVAS